MKAQDYGISSDDIPLLYTVINIARTVIGIPAVILADKEKRILVLGCFVFIISLLLMIFLPSTQYMYAYLIASIFGLYLGIIETIQRAVIPKYISSERHGTAYGLYYLIIGLSFFVCNIIIYCSGYRNTLVHSKVFVFMISKSST